MTDWQQAAGNREQGTTTTDWQQATGSRQEGRTTGQDQQEQQRLSSRSSLLPAALLPAACSLLPVQQLASVETFNASLSD
jgi:hypothetical protein